MNRLFGWMSPLGGWDHSILNKTSFKPLLWSPDHDGVYVDKSIVLTSVQRFITPQCSRAQMPFLHQSSGLYIVADVYLVQRERLCRQLHVSTELADAELILLGYLKWGTGVTCYLTGEFCFAIWNPSLQSLFIATDQLGKRPLLYAYKPRHYFTFANELSPFRSTCDSLTINQDMFAHVALDALPGAETCYKEVFKLLPGHQLHVTPDGMKQTCYWRLQDQRQKLRYQSRESYYDAFRMIFHEAVKDTLRSSYPITAHISGGLDSSSVAAQAAMLLAEQQRSLLGFTAMPNGLEGPSYRNGFIYNEMPNIEPLLERYSNIQHFSYQSVPKKNIFQRLQAYSAFVDQPCRNISNMDWILGCYEYARQQGSRVILIGAKGNATISWSGYNWKRWLRHWKQMILLQMKPQSAFQNYFFNCNSDFLNSKFAKKILRQNLVSVFPHFSQLSNLKSALGKTTYYPISLCNGVLSLDPTSDLRVVEFCYNVPDWVYCDGNEIVNNRLLVRRGLSHLLPSEITRNTLRGEQAADWFLHYNEHASTWLEQLDAISDDTKNILAGYYNHQKYRDLHHSVLLPLKENDSKTRTKIDYLLLRYMSAAFFLNYLIEGLT
jgi:asparagine synthase (glutamine-hydrolysing)